MVLNQKKLKDLKNLSNQKNQANRKIRNMYTNNRKMFYTHIPSHPNFVFV